MSDVIQSITDIPTPFKLVVLIMLIVTTSSLLGTIATQIRKWACQRQELDFKRELLDRGMSVDEIERMVRSKGAATESQGKGRWC